MSVIHYLLSTGECVHDCLTPIEQSPYAYLASAATPAESCDRCIARRRNAETRIDHCAIAFAALETRTPSTGNTIALNPCRPTVSLAWRAWCGFVVGVLIAELVCLFAIHVLNLG